MKRRQVHQNQTNFGSNPIHLFFPLPPFFFSLSSSFHLCDHLFNKYSLNHLNAPRTRLWSQWSNKFLAFFADCNWATYELYFLLRNKINFQELFKAAEWLNPHFFFYNTNLCVKWGLSTFVAVCCLMHARSNIPDFY